MAQLFYHGHGSYRITGKTGVTVYIDPYAGEGYDKPADIILVTHEHGDHNNVGLVPQKPGCRIVRSADVLHDGEYAMLTICGVQIEAVQAYNGHHQKDECVGFILTLDGVTVYASGDTSETEQMKSFASRAIDWALLPIDGIYNMGPEEASACAKLIGAAHTIPIHMKPGALFSKGCAEKFHANGRVIVKPGETVEL